VNHGTLIAHGSIDGRIVPYVRRPNKTSRTCPRARKYHASQNRIAWCLRAGVGPGQLPTGFVVRIVVHVRGKQRGDVDNYAKAVLDAAQHGRLCADDRECLGVEAYVRTEQGFDRVDWWIFAPADDAGGEHAA